MQGLMRCCLCLWILSWAALAWAGAQQYQNLADAVRSNLSHQISDLPAPDTSFSSLNNKWEWLFAMSGRLGRWMPDLLARLEFLQTEHYEAVRAGIDPQLVLAIIEVESHFQKYALSQAGAIGYMQVMPFWTGLIGRRTDNLFHLRTSLRYGCVILRFYIDMEKGDLLRALSRYNGSPKNNLTYAHKVLAAWKRHWSYKPVVHYSLARQIYLLHDRLRRVYSTLSA